jgi:hypothetical protein
MGSTLVAFGVGAIVSSVIGVATVSHAITDVRASGFSCQVVNGQQAPALVAAGNDSTVAALTVACPVPDVYNGIQNIGVVQAQLEDRSSTASPSASRCVNLVMANGATGTSCGPSATAPAAHVGHMTLKPMPNEAWAPANFGYMSIILPPRTGIGRSTVQGIHAF